MKNKNWFWGLFFIAAAALIVLSQFGVLSDVSLISLILTILLIPVIIKSAIALNFTGILFPIAFLGIIYAEPLGITNLVPWPILITALFLSIGFHILFGKHIGNFINISGSNSSCFSNDEHFKEIVNNQDESNVEYRVNFSSGVKYINSENLKNVKLSCSFGALKAFFDNSTPDENGVTIYLDSSFSGVELYLPKEWKIVNNLNVSLSGVEEKNRRVDSNGPTVTFLGNISFSGVEIIYI